MTAGQKRTTRDGRKVVLVGRMCERDEVRFAPWIGQFDDSGNFGRWWDDGRYCLSVAPELDLVGGVLP